MLKHHDKIERNSIILLILTVVVISIGGLVEIAPLFRLETTIEKVKTGTHEVTKSKMDISVIGADPYGWAYAKLKTHYEGIFGASNVIDC